MSACPHTRGAVKVWALFYAGTMISVQMIARFRNAVEGNISSLHDVQAFHHGAQLAMRFAGMKNFYKVMCSNS